jgi:hypothetical protein
MRFDFDSLIESLIAGEHVPIAEVQDLRAALLFFSDARAVLARHYEDAQSQDPQQLSFFLEDLAMRCSPAANLLAVVIRGMLLEQILKLSADVEEHETITGEIAKMPLLAADLKDPEGVFLRLRKMME